MQREARRRRHPRLTRQRRPRRDTRIRPGRGPLRRPDEAQGATGRRRAHAGGVRRGEAEGPRFLTDPRPACRVCPWGCPSHRRGWGATRTGHGSGWSPEGGATWLTTWRTLTVVSSRLWPHCAAHAQAPSTPSTVRRVGSRRCLSAGSTTSLTSEPAVRSANEPQREQGRPSGPCRLGSRGRDGRPTAEWSGARVRTASAGLRPAAKLGMHRSGSASRLRAGRGGRLVT